MDTTQLESLRIDADAGARARCAARRLEILCEHMVHGFHVRREAYEAARLPKESNLLDVTGLDDDGFLTAVCQRWSHKGSAVGCDIEEGPFADGIKVGNEGQDPIVRVRAPGTRVPFANGSFDGVFLRRPVQSRLAPSDLLRELRRVVRPAGRVVLVTVSEVNYRLAMEFVRRLARETPEFHLRAASPWPRTEKAMTLFAPVFGPMEVRVLDEAIHFRKLDEFMEFFATLRDQFDPMPGDTAWAEALARVARWVLTWFEARQTVTEPETTCIFVGTVR